MADIYDQSLPPGTRQYDFATGNFKVGPLIGPSGGYDPTSGVGPNYQQVGQAQTAGAVRAGAIPPLNAFQMLGQNQGAQYAPGYLQGLQSGLGINTQLPAASSPRGLIGTGSMRPGGQLALPSAPTARVQGSSMPLASGTSTRTNPNTGFRQNRMNIPPGEEPPTSFRPLPPVGGGGGAVQTAPRGTGTTQTGGTSVSGRGGTPAPLPIQYTPPQATAGRGVAPQTQAAGSYWPQNYTPGQNAYAPYGNPNVNPNWYRPPNDQTSYPGGWGTNVASSYLNYLQPNILNANQNWMNQSGGMNQFFGANPMQNPYSALMNMLGGNWGSGGMGAPSTGSSQGLAGLLLGGAPNNSTYYPGGVGSLLNQIMNLGLPNQRTIEGLVPGQAGVGTGMQGTTMDALTQALQGGGLTPQYVQAMRQQVLEPSQEALSGRLNQQGGGVVSPTSGLQQELQRRNERDFNNQLIMAGQQNYGNYLGQGQQLGQSALLNALGGFGSVAQNAAPYFSQAGNLGLGLAGLGQQGQNQQATQYQNLLNTMMGGNLQNNQQALSAYLGQLGQYGGLANTGLQGDTSLARAQYETQTMADLAKMNSIGILLQNIFGGGGGGGGFNIGLPDINIPIGGGGGQWFDPWSDPGGYSIPPNWGYDDFDWRNFP